ncbi:MAG: FAD-dependent oxidoreductase, partial [Burkholderiales bacterium]|nr:FAD-dependent oxidoreductase [Burkholderiales bacterium]
RTLEVLDRLGCGDPVVEKGIGWRIGKVFHGDRLAYRFDLLPEAGHKRPAFVNLQQYYLEEALLARVAALGRTEVRWKNRVTGVTPLADGARLAIETPDGTYTLDADWVIACDGARSMVRASLGLDFRGQVFRDRFLIADVHMVGDYPTERWFWFDPPFHPQQSVLLHRQADDVWRIDFQLGWDADPEVEKQPERVIPRIRAMLGDDRPFELEWVSVYTFQCRRLDRFVHGRVVFAGDAAHQVSPFGARGCNSGVQDADNLGWKLARVLRGASPATLIDTYDAERIEAADENIRESTRSTDFITPKSAVSRVFRDAVLALAQDHAFARRLVNSGRLSLPTTYRAAAALSTADVDAFDAAVSPGSPAIDAPVAMPDGRAVAWIDLLGGRFDAVLFAPSTPDAIGAAVAMLARATDEPLRISVVFATVAAAQTAASAVTGPDVRAVIDAQGLLAQRLDASPGCVYLLRPDQHVAARWRQPDAAALRRAHRRATGRVPTDPPILDADEAEHRTQPAAA